MISAKANEQVRIEQIGGALTMPGWMWAELKGENERLRAELTTLRLENERLRLHVVDTNESERREGGTMSEERREWMKLVAELRAENERLRGTNEVLVENLASRDHSIAAYLAERVELQAENERLRKPFNDQLPMTGINCLRYIAESPAPEYGGFNENTVAAAKWAIEEIEKMQELLETACDAWESSKSYPLDRDDTPLNDYRWAGLPQSWYDAARQACGEGGDKETGE